MPGQAAVQDRADPIDVRGGLGLGAGEDLGGGVAERRPAHRGPVHAHDRGRPEPAQDGAFGGEEDLARCHVAVQQPLGVARGQGVEDGRRDLDHAVEGHGALVLQRVGQDEPRPRLAHHAEQAPVGEGAAHGLDPRGGELHQALHLVVKRLLLLPAHRAREDGHVDVQALAALPVAAAEHDARAVAAVDLLDLEARRHQGQGPVGLGGRGEPLDRGEQVAVVAGGQSQVEAGHVLVLAPGAPGDHVLEAAPRGGRAAVGEQGSAGAQHRPGIGPRPGARDPLHQALHLGHVQGEGQIHGQVGAHVDPTQGPGQIQVRQVHVHGGRRRGHAAAGVEQLAAHGGQIDLPLGADDLDPVALPDLLGLGEGHVGQPREVRAPAPDPAEQVEDLEQVRVVDVEAQKEQGPRAHGLLHELEEHLVRPHAAARGRRAQDEGLLGAAQGQAVHVRVGHHVQGPAGPGEDLVEHVGVGRGEQGAPGDLGEHGQALGHGLAVRGPGHLGQQVLQGVVAQVTVQVPEDGARAPLLEQIEHLGPGLGIEPFG